MILTRYEMLMARARHMFSEALGQRLSDAQILAKTKGDTLEAKLRGIEIVTGLVNPDYWRDRGL